MIIGWWYFQCYVWAWSEGGVLCGMNWSGWFLRAYRYYSSEWKVWLRGVLKNNEQSVDCWTYGTNQKQLGSVVLVLFCLYSTACCHSWPHINECALTITSRLRLSFLALELWGSCCFKLHLNQIRTSYIINFSMMVYRYRNQNIEAHFFSSCKNTCYILIIL